MFISTKQVEEIKRIDLPQLIQSKGIKLINSNGNGSYKILCPFHNDTNPSLNLSRKGNMWVWHCFGCSEGGSAIDFVMKYEKLSFTKAVRRLSRLELNNPIQAASYEKNYLDTIVEYYHNTLKGKDRRGLEYLKRRGIADQEIIDRFKTGYANGSLLKLLPKDTEKTSKLMELGILNNKGRECFCNCIIFPIVDENSNTVGLYGRNIEFSNHLYLKGPHRGVFNWQAIEAYPEIIITESIVDCLSLYKLGYRNTVPIYGTNGLTEKHISLFKKYTTKKIILCLDNDESGNKAVHRLAERLKILEIPVTAIQLPQKIKDPNELLLNNSSHGLLESLFKTQTILYTPELTHSRQGLIDYSEDHAEFKFNELVYRIRGIKLTETDSLRLIVNTLRNGSQHLDRFDLYSDKSRQTFTNKCAEKLGAGSREIEGHLLSIIKEIEIIKDRAVEEGLRKAEDTELSEQEKKTGLKLLTSKNILDEVEKDLTTLGYVGEPLNKKIVYLVATSRLLSKPLSSIIVSQSGAGKSYLSEKIEELMPPEHVESYSRITPQSLYYMEKHELMHKLVIIEERDGMVEADYPIRTLQSRKKLTLAAPIKDPSTGKTRTVRFEVYGPIAHIETTAQRNINPENANRCFILHLDESERQTRLIQEQQNRSKSLNALERESAKSAIIQKHTAAQKLLRPLKVVIPYQQYIGFPSRWITSRRYNEQFLSLIEVATFLNQYNREIKYTISGAEYIESTIDDYRTAYNLAKIILMQSMDELTKDSRELLQLLKKKIQKDEELIFTRRDLTKWTGWTYHRAKEAVRVLADVEYISTNGTGRGSTCYYQLTPYALDRKEHLLLELTTPEELCIKIGQV